MYYNVDHGTPMKLLEVESSKQGLVRFTGESSSLLNVRENCYMGNGNTNNNNGNIGQPAENSHQSNATWQTSLDNQTMMSPSKYPTTYRNLEDIEEGQAEDSNAGELTTPDDITSGEVYINWNSEYDPHIPNNSLLTDTESDTENATPTVTPGNTSSASSESQASTKSADQSRFNVDELDDNEPELAPECHCSSRSKYTHHSHRGGYVNQEFIPDA